MRLEAFIVRRAFALNFLTLFKFSFVGYLQNFDNACLRCFMASLHSSLYHGLLLWICREFESMFGVNWLLGSGEKVKHRFSRWLPSWISDRHDLSYFLFTSHPNASYYVWSQLAIWFRKRSKKIDFQDGGYLGFPNGRISFFFFDLQVTPMLPSKFGVKWPFGSGEAKNRFSRWRPSWVSDWNDFCYFWSTSYPDAS